MKKDSLDNFFRKDLNLKNRWWHRLFFITFIILFVVITWTVISNMLDDAQLPKYTNVGMLSDRMTSDIRLIGDLVKDNEKIAVYEHNLYGTYQGKSFYDGNGGWLLKQQYYCSKNISDQVEKITAITGINHYGGGTPLSSLSDFKNYLKKNNATCVLVSNLDPDEYIGNVKKLLNWGFEADDMAVWKESLVKSIFAVLQSIFFIILGFFILMVLYYKVFLYIIFGSKKDI